MMTQSVKGKTKEEAQKLFEQFHELVTGRASANGNHSALGKFPAAVYNYRVNATTHGTPNLDSRLWKTLSDFDRGRVTRNMADQAALLGIADKRLMHKLRQFHGGELGESP